MFTKYTIIPVSGEAVELTIDWPHDPGYDRIKTLVTPLIGGGWLKHVTVLYNGRAHDMFVDEEGLLKGFERNEQATKIYCAAYLARLPKTNPEDLAWIAGPAILFHRRVWF